MLSGCWIEEGFSEHDAHRIGSWLASSGTTDVVDAHVVAVAGHSAGSVAYTDDVEDLRSVARVADQQVTIQPV
ncbi:MAG: hypothetical protein DLM54_10570 [Acidimicrobiales bacterium]|nr:MAG: hypothetical protein DLM54_10570 [Acidimicrobiales bacterium]